MIGIRPARLDSYSESIISYVVINGPVTMYQVARDLNYHFSLTYRKAKKLEQLGFLKAERGPLSTLYDVTVYGLLYCFINDNAPKNVVIHKLKRLLGLETFSDEEVESFIKFFIKVTDHDLSMLNLSTMITYIVYKCGADYLRCMSTLDDKDRSLARQVMTYGITQTIYKLLSAQVRDLERPLRTQQLTNIEFNG